MGHPQVFSSVYKKNIIKMCLINAPTPKNDSKYENASFAPSYIYLTVVFHVQIYTHNYSGSNKNYPNPQRSALIFAMRN